MSDDDGWTPFHNLAARMKAQGALTDKRNFRCSFCGKERREVKRMVAGPMAFICNECIELCAEIVADAPASPPIAPGTDG